IIPVIAVTAPHRRCKLIGAVCGSDVPSDDRGIVWPGRRKVTKDVGIMKAFNVESRTLRGDPSYAVTTEPSGVLATLLGQNAEPSREPGNCPEPDVQLGRLHLDANCCRAFWNDQDVGLTLGEYNFVHHLASRPGHHVTYRALYDRVRGKGFVAGYGADGYRGNVRSAIRRIRQKFCACDPAFDEIENYAGFGYCWRKPTSAV